jgi:CBS domain-containing protein
MDTMAEKSNATMKVKDIMTKNPATLGRNETLDVADDIMTLGRIRHMPVVDEGRLVGVVSQRDLFRSAVASALGYGGKAQRTITKTIRVKEVMSEPVITISPDTSIKEAARRMMESKIGCLPVVENDQLVGLVTETDILRYVAEH